METREERATGKVTALAGNAGLLILALVFWWPRPLDHLGQPAVRITLAALTWSLPWLVLVAVWSRRDRLSVPVVAWLSLSAWYLSRCVVTPTTLGRQDLMLLVYGLGAGLVLACALGTLRRPTSPVVRLGLGLLLSFVFVIFGAATTGALDAALHLQSTAPPPALVLGLAWAGLLACLPLFWLGYLLDWRPHRMATVWLPVLCVLLAAWPLMRPRMTMTSLAMNDEGGQAAKLTMTAATLSPDGRRLAFSRGQGRIDVVDTSRIDAGYRELAHHAPEVLALEFLDTTRLLSVGTQDQVIAWDALGEDPPSALGRAVPYRRARASNDGAWVLTLPLDGPAELRTSEGLLVHEWDATTPPSLESGRNAFVQRLLRPRPQHPPHVRQARWADAVFSPDDRFAVLVDGQAASCSVVDVTTGDVLAPALPCHPRIRPSVTDEGAVLTVEPTAREAWPEAHGRKVTLWSTTGESLHQLEIDADDAPVRAATVSPDGRWLHVLLSKTLLTRDLVTGEEMRWKPRSSPDVLRPLPDGQSVLTAGEQVHLHQLGTRTELLAARESFKANRLLVDREGTLLVAHDSRSRLLAAWRLSESRAPAPESALLLLLAAGLLPLALGLGPVTSEREPSPGT
ncbi:MAG: WD40 repeat domain-containing protein [Acidobacteriota bacterium]